MGAIMLTEKEQKTYDLAMEVIHKKLSIVEFSILINKSYSQSKRIIKKVRDKKMFGVKHGNFGKRPWNKTPQETLDDVEELLRGDYKTFNLTHFREMIKTHEGMDVGKNVIHALAQKKGLVKRPKRRIKKVHKLRPRMPKAGMLIQFDGSQHQWMPDLICDLIAGIDDATGIVVGAEFFLGETSLHCMKVMKHIVEENGVPEAFYLDGAGYFGKHDRETNTQIGRALEEVHCNCLIAGSAQAKGRIERLWNTFQDRLIAELNFYQIRTIDEANKFLKEDFLPRYNEQFSVSARESKSAYKEVENINLDLIFCKKERRKIGSGMQFSYQNQLFIVDENRDYRFRFININHHVNGTRSFDIMGKMIKVKPYLKVMESSAA